MTNSKEDIDIAKANHIPMFPPLCSAQILYSLQLAKKELMGQNHLFESHKLREVWIMDICGFQASS